MPDDLNYETLPLTPGRRSPDPRASAIGMLAAATLTLAGSIGLGLGSIANALTNNPPNSGQYAITAGFILLAVAVLLMTFFLARYSNA